MKLQVGLFRFQAMMPLRRLSNVAYSAALAWTMAALLVVFAPAALAQPTVSLAQVPLLALKSAPGLVMLTMSRDHRLFYAAYNDTSDLDGDGVVDVGFKPNITYYGNFVSDRCYDYNGTPDTTPSTSRKFSPVALATATGCKVGATRRWHGNWLNWAATSRIDALRRVLYGGYRVSDPSGSGAVTLLQGSFVPNDSHIWGKEFRPGRDAYDIEQYADLAAPTGASKQHLFVVKSPNVAAGTYPFNTSNAPNLRFITNADQTTERIWLWASADVAQGIGADTANFSKGGGRNSVASVAVAIRVDACVPIGGVREAGCVGYPTTSTPVIWKPTGVLHDYSVNDALKFGLITGSYQKNYSGGVLRRNIASFKSEISAATGQFSTNDGIARTMDRLTVHGWNSSGSTYDCGYLTTANRPEGACKSWGAPVGEMMYEGLRYLSGKSASTSAYSSGVATGADLTMGFSAPPAWLNPFRAKADGGNPICSRPVQMVIADPLTSFDSDQLPGSYYAPTAGFGTALGSSDLAGLNVTTEADAIWAAEGLGTRNVFIGQSNALNYDGNPTPKPASGFSQLIGHAPDETQSRGSFYSAGVARFGRVTGIPVGAPTGYPTVVPTVPGQKLDTLAVALGSLTPKIEFNNPQGGKISIIPLSKAVANAGIVRTPGAYQATGAITGFYYANSTPTSVSAVVNFSDADQGTDNETDAQVRYDISLVGNSLTIQMTQIDPAPGGIQSNLGFVISGTGTATDGLYLETRTSNSNPAQIYYLDTLAGQLPKTAASPLNGTVLPTFGTTTSRVFVVTAPSSSGSFIPHDTLWYAAKYGGPTDAAGVPIVDSNGDPVNYFKVTNPSNLPAQMGKAFRSAAALAAVASTSVVGVQRSSGSAAVYQANYDSLTWSSRIYAFGVLASGAVSNTQLWEASTLVPAPGTRSNLYLGRGGTTTPLALTSGGYASLSSSGTPSEQADFGNAGIYQYILGDKLFEERRGGAGAVFRNRGTAAGAEYGSVIGDIVNSDPQIIAKKDYGYTAGDATYAAYLSSLTTESLAVGANDGFFHIFNAAATAAGGGELLGFMPQAARNNIKDLAKPEYAHRYFVDGSIGQGHAKIAVPGDATVSWRTVVVGTGGAGAKTVFAINAPNSQAYSANNILWEINENAVAFAGKLGNVVGRPGIGKLKNGTWVAIFGNGYNSTVNSASLFVVRLSDGALIAEIGTNTATGNGLGDTEIVNTTSGTMDTIEYVYAADFKGNIWRFDISATTVSSWPATGALVYSTPTGRPITAEIKVGPAVGGTPALTGKMVYFGTGSYLNLADTTTTSPNQALYGIYDDLLSTTNLTPAVVESNLVGMSITMPSAASDKRTTTTSATPWFSTTGKKGWLVPLTGTNVAAGERVIAPPVRFTVPGLVDAFYFTSIVPGTDECIASLDTWVTGIDAMTGGYAKAFAGDPENSLKVVGGSPRGVFVLGDGPSPTLYISQTIFNDTISPTTYATTTGGAATVTINGVIGKTRILGIGLPKNTGSVRAKRQIWRQLK